MKTVGTIEIASNIRRPGETEESAVNRVKSWLREGLLREFLQEAEPGTGRRRLYARRAILDAFLLQMLIDYTGMSAVEAATVLPDIKRHFRREKADTKLLLFMGRSPDGSWHVAAEPVRLPRPGRDPVLENPVLDYLINSDHPVEVVVRPKRVLERLDLLED